MTAQSARPESPPEMDRVPNGPAAAAFVAAGIGSLILGLITTVAEASVPVRTAITLSAEAGPLSGKTTLAVISWLGAWVILHAIWRSRSLDFGRVSWWTYGLIALGLLGTFPPFFEMFGG